MFAFLFAYVWVLLSLVDVVYFWIGRSCSIDDKGSAAMQAADFSKQFGRSVMLVRVTQNREPDHFLSHYPYSFVVRRGHRDQWLDDVQKRASLYQVRGSSKLQARAIEMEAVSFSLSSSDVYIVTNPADKRVFVWAGKRANEFELAYAQSFVKNSVALASAGASYQVENIKEDSEPKLFWDTLGGNAEYAKNFDLERKRRFFFCTDRTSVFKVNEIEDFIQDDLQERGVVMLDGYVEIFLWVGAKATQKEKDMALQTAEDYIREADDGRPSNCPLYRVNANEEPNTFYVYFQGWDLPAPGTPQTQTAPVPIIATPQVPVSPSPDPEPSPRDSAVTSSDAIATPRSASSTSSAATGSRARMGSHAPAMQKLQPVTSSSDSLPSRRSLHRQESKAILLKDAIVAPVEQVEANTPRFTPQRNPLNPEGVTWDFDRLKVKPLPPGVEPTRLESYLSQQEFVQILKMTPDAFYKCPKWKQTVLKKDAQLF